MPFPQTNPALARALDARGYTEPTPVQLAVLQPEADARDLLVSAQTGSGKTVAFGIAFAASLLGAETVAPPPGPPLALVICPTRELAQQVHRELSWLYAETGARIVACIGGMEPRAEARALDNGCHIVVGTPGRLVDHLRRTRLDLSALRVAVLDEADEMLDLGFREELETLLSAAPDWRRTLLFSATIAHDIAALAKKYQKDALRIDTLVRNQPHADIEYRVVRTAPQETLHAVVNVLRHVESPTALVFCATREGVKHLQSFLLERGFAVVALSGELSQAERTRALQSIRDGQARICVATDVAARGLDLPDLGLVIHADLPTNPQILLHRSGRTGRAGRKGICVVVVAVNRGRRAEQLLGAAGVKAEWLVAPDAEAIRAQDAERLLADPMLTEAVAPEDEALVARLLAERSPEQLAAALIRQQRARLPSPEDLSDPWVRPERPQRRETIRGPRDDAERRPYDDSRPRREPSEPREPRRESGPMAWFSLNVGRDKKADPKWLVPLICRMGQVTKREIGAIRIFDTDTRFEIAQDARDAFVAALPANDPEGVVIAPSSAPSAAPPPRYRATPSRERYVADGPREAPRERHRADPKRAPHTPDAPREILADEPPRPAYNPDAPRRPAKAKTGAAKPFKGKPAAGKPFKAKPAKRPRG